MGFWPHAMYLCGVNLKLVVNHCVILFLASLSRFLMFGEGNRNLFLSQGVFSAFFFG